MTLITIATLVAQLLAFSIVYVRRHHTVLGATGWIILIAASTLTTISAYLAIWSPNGLNLGLPSTSLLILTAMHLAMVIGGTHHKTWALSLITLPPTLIATVASALVQTELKTPFSSVGEATHILLAICGYSLLLITAVQAAGLAYQDNALRSHQLSKLAKSLPPIQRMESGMFRTMLLGTVFLGAAIVMAFLVYDNLLERNVAHKTLFAILAFVAYVVVLVGRFTKGWSGVRAVKLTSVATLLLLLAYFGAETISMMLGR